MSDTQDNKIRPPYGPPRRNVPPPPMPAPDAQMSDMQQGPMMPPRTWQQRFLFNYGTGLLAQRQEKSPVPSWLIGKSILFFFISLCACLLVFGYVPGMDLLMAACLSVVVFFYGSITISRNWSRASEKNFRKSIFTIGFVIRLVWVLYMYFIFNPEHYNNTYGDTADVDWYMGFGRDLAAWMRGDLTSTFEQIMEWSQSAIDDVGYPIWLAVIYLLTGGISDVFIPMVVKCIVSAYCAICIYRIAKRHFGLGAARMAAIFVCLNPNMIYWCASMMKEAEMVFLCCLAVDKLDQALSSGNKLTLRSLWPGLLAGLYLMFYRSALGLVVFLAVMAHIVLASRKVISYGKKIIAGVLVAATLFISVGDRIRVQSEELLDMVRSDHQKNNMEWRSEREGGNDFAKYAGAAVFAPLIFTIPFPTFNQANEFQLLQIQLAGGSYIKNILSFFIIVVLILMVLSGDWRKHVFILSYTCGYLVVLVFSQFAQSGRFHMPIVPFLMLFAAYGIQLAKNNKRLQRGFTLVLIAEIAISLFWNWFKLAGRGLA